MPRLAWNRAATAAFVLALLWPLVTLDSAAALATPRSSQSPRRDTAPGPARGPDFEQQGVRVGDVVNSLEVHTLDGDKVDLATAWKDKPALIVTASLTCPIARRECPRLKSAMDVLGKDVNVILLYTIEAHPKGDASPYRPDQGEWVTPQNQREGILKPQPKTLGERLALARDLHERLAGVAPMYVDSMENIAWKALGSGPNVALLVDTNGKVIAKQGWLDADDMLLAWFNHRIAGASREPDPDALGKPLRPRLEAFIESLKSDDRSRIDAFFAPDARMWFGEKTGEGILLSEGGWREWDREMHAAHTIERSSMSGRSVLVISHEISDFARLVEFPGWRAFVAYDFNADGIVTAVLYQPMPITPSMNECFKPALEWVRHTHAEDLKAIYPKDQFAPSAETARRWRELLIEWRKTTGKPDIDLAQKPQ